MSCDAPGPPWRDWLLALVTVLILADAFDAPLYRLFGWRALAFPGVPVSRLPFFAVFGLVAVLLRHYLRRAADCVRAAWPLWPAVVFACVSAVWSERPATTLVWAAALLGTSAFGVALAVRFSARAQCNLAAAAAAFVALASTLTVLLWPVLGVSRTGAWRGLYIDKNLLGRIVALGVAAAPVAAVHDRQRTVAVAALLVCGGVLTATQSRASLFAALIAAAGALLLAAARARPRHAAAILATGAAAALLAVVFLVATGPGIALVARSQTLNQRTKLWRAVAAAGRETPWIGRGYGAFWPSAPGEKVRAVVGISGEPRPQRRPRSLRRARRRRGLPRPRAARSVRSRCRESRLGAGYRRMQLAGRVRCLLHRQQRR